jgi:hypothetical protein
MTPKIMSKQEKQLFDSMRELPKHRLEGIPARKNLFFNSYNLGSHSRSKSRENTGSLEGSAQDQVEFEVQPSWRVTKAQPLLRVDPK